MISLTQTGTRRSRPRKKGEEFHDTHGRHAKMAVPTSGAEERDRDCRRGLWGREEDGLERREQEPGEILQSRSI